MKRNLLLLLGAFFSFLVVAELILGAFFPISDPFDYKKQEQTKYIVSQFPAGLRLETSTEEGLPGMDGTGIFSTNNAGFRGAEMSIRKPSNEFRVFLVGGSTAECFYLDDAKCLSAVIERELRARVPQEKKVYVYGAGKSGDRSDDHIAMLSQRIAHFKPDLVIVLCGVNDLIAAIHERDYLHIPGRAKRRFTVRTLLALLATEFQIPRYIYFSRLKGMNDFAQEDPELEVIALNSNYRKLVERSKGIVSAHVSPRMDVRSYRTNLETIAGMGLGWKIPVLFVTQPSTWNSTVDRGAEGWHWMLFGYKERDMDRALKAYNESMRQVAARTSMPLCDLEALMPKSLKYFYDDVHFNSGGALAAGTAIAEIAAKEGLIQSKQEKEVTP